MPPMQPNSYMTAQDPISSRTHLRHLADQSWAPETHPTVHAWPVRQALATRVSRPSRARTPTHSRARKHMTRFRRRPSNPFAESILHARTGVTHARCEPPPRKHNQLGKERERHLRNFAKISQKTPSTFFTPPLRSLNMSGPVHVSTETGQSQRSWVRQTLAQT